MNWLKISVITQATIGLVACGGGYYLFPSDRAANVVDLEEEGIADGNVIFADNGTEQYALAEFLFESFPVYAIDTTDALPAYTDENVEAADDMRIQNLDEVALDTVLP